MRIGVCAAAFVMGALDDFKPDAVVSIHSPRRPAVAPFDGPLLRLVCHDIEAGVRGCIAPSIWHAEALRDFVVEHQPERLLIHCRAGLSRSPAYALQAALHAESAASPAEQCRRLAAIAPGLIPNRLVVAIADHLLGLDGLFLQARLDAFAIGPRAVFGALGPESPFTAWEVGR